MEIVCCNNISDEVTYQIFSEGYSDYILKVEFSLEDFVHRFMTIEADREYSYVMMDSKRPVGMMLGGVHSYNGLKTMRCGGFAVAPDMRSKGIGKMLFEKHKETALSLGCKQIYLEVLCDNLNAFRLYERLGYENLYHYKYYKMDSTQAYMENEIEAGEGYRIVEVDSDFAMSIRETINDTHIHWQGEMFIIKQYDDVKYYALYKADKCIGCIGIRDVGYLAFLWIDKTYRQMGYGKLLMSYGIKQMNIDMLTAVTSNNMLYEGFLKKCGFEFVLGQHEMVQLL